MSRQNPDDVQFTTVAGVKPVLILCALIALLAVTHSLFAASMYGAEENKRLLCTVAAFVVVVVTGSSCWFLYVMQRGVFSVLILWVLATSLFTLPSALLWIIADDRIFSTRWYFQQDPGVLGGAFCLTSIAVIGFTLGCVGGSVSGSKGKLNQGQYSRRSVLAVGLALYAASIVSIIFLYSKGEVGELMGREGYAALTNAKTLGLSGRMFFFSAEIFLPWSLLLLISSTHPKKSIVWTAVACLIGIIAMLATGDRTGPVLILGLFIPILTLTGRPISMKAMRPWIIGGVAAVLLGIPLVRVVRLSAWNELSFSEVASLAAGLEESLAINPLKDPLMGLVDETNGTLQASYAVAEAFPLEDEFRYGRDLLMPCVVWIPYHSKLLAPIGWTYWDRNSQDGAGLSQWFNRRAGIGDQWGLGFSQVAEYYAQFGIFGMTPLFGLLGYVVCWMWTRAGKMIRPRPELIGYYSIIWYTLLVAVRNTMMPVGRGVAWGFALCILCPKVVQWLFLRHPSANSRVSIHGR